MEPAVPRLLSDLRRLTPARVGLGRSGVSLPTQALLDFTLAHARARDAVHAGFDAAAITAQLQALGLTTLQAESQAGDRKTYLARPDLGRQLAPAARDRLAAQGRGGCDVAFVVGDGLSPVAVTAQAPGLLQSLLPRLAAERIAVGPTVVATGARVALGDAIGELLGARIVVVLIGERPGMSAPHSLGAYLTFAPRPGLTDADRNCLSNIHPAGLGLDEAAAKIAWLLREQLARKLSGVALKDDSGADARALAAVSREPRPMD